MKTISLFGKGAVSGYILFVLMTLCSISSAQQPPHSNQSLITGLVYDSGGGIMDASVSILGSDVVVYTTEDGSYSISASSSDVLVFAYAGYASVEVLVGSQMVIDVELSGSVALEEAVINAGYYTVKDRERTGSIFRVSSDVIENQPVNNFLEALQGRVPGLEIIPSSGVAGGGYTVRIRGQNSIAAGNDPLYIVDGVPFNTAPLGSQSISGTILPRADVNPLNTLDPSVIESIEVLKDADATAIYGSRGANGVILISTKKGKTGKTVFSADFSTSVIAVTKMMDLLNTEQYIAMRQEAFANNGISTYPATAYDINGTWDTQRYTDWQKEFIGNPAFNNTLKFNLSGGNEFTRFTLGSSLMKETTVFPFDYSYNRTTVFTSIQHFSKDKKFQLNLSANYGLDNNHLPATDITSRAYILPPNAPSLYTENGELNWENSTWTNPYGDLQSTYRNNSRSIYFNSLLSYEIFRNWKVKTSFGYTNALLNETKANPVTRFNPAWGLTSASSNFFENNSENGSWLIEPQLEGKINWGLSEFLITLGTTLQDQSFSQTAVLGIGYPTDQLLSNINAANQVIYLNVDDRQYRYLAGYARLNYSLMNRYIINLTGRRDGSSRFGPGNRFANFGAVGAAWIFSKEAFLENSDFLSFGKLRASYGSTGNDQIGDYQYLSTYSVNESSYNGNIGLIPTRLYNPNFAWEKNTKAQAVIEIALFQNKLQLEAAYYNSRSDNQLAGTPLPGTTGFSSINSNMNALVENSGWELSLNSTNIKSANFTWSSNFQLTLPQTKLLAYDDLENSTNANYLEIGYPLNIIKIYEFTGVDPETGIFTFKDFNGDGIISGTDDRKFIADFTPTFFGSLTNQFRYKRFNLDFTFHFVKKEAFNEFYNFAPAGTMSNQSTSVLNHWQNPGDNSTYQLFTTENNSEALQAQSQFAYSSGAISDASFIRLKTVNLSYQLPLPRILNCLVYLQGQNLFTITGFKGGDPEQMRGFLPPVRRFSIGAKIEL